MKQLTLRRGRLLLLTVKTSLLDVVPWRSIIRRWVAFSITFLLHSGVIPRKGAVLLSRHDFFELAQNAKAVHDDKQFRFLFSKRNTFLLKLLLFIFRLLSSFKTRLIFRFKGSGHHIFYCKCSQRAVVLLGVYFRKKRHLHTRWSWRTPVSVREGH